MGTNHEIGETNALYQFFVGMITFCLHVTISVKISKTKIPNSTRFLWRVLFVKIFLALGKIVSKILDDFPNTVKESTFIPEDFRFPQILKILS